jgi:hypothetical protein
LVPLLAHLVCHVPLAIAYFTLHFRALFLLSTIYIVLTP